MTAHVAERGEGRGRVVLRLSGAHLASEHAIQAAVQVAKAFHSEIESLFIADRQIFDAASYGFLREIRAGGVSSLTGDVGDGSLEASVEARGGFDVAAIERQIKLAARSMQRRVDELAAREDVPVFGRLVHDTPLRALANACQMAGPWNVVALGEPFTADSLARLDTLFERVTGMTGVVMVGPRARASSGPVVAVIEDVERVTGMLRAAQRLAGAMGREVLVAIAASSKSAKVWVSNEVRRVIAGSPFMEVVELGRPGGGTAVVAEALRQLNASFIIAEHGGQVVPRSGDSKALALSVTCPLLVVR